MKKKAQKVTPPKPKHKTISKKKSAKKVPAATMQPDLPAEIDPVRFGRQPIEFYTEKYGNRFRVIDNIGFVYSNGRWVAVDVDGFTYMEREICAGHPDFVAV